MTERARRGKVPVRLSRLAVGYTRYSTEEQGSTPEQVGINDEIAADEAVEIVHTFSDEGVSRTMSDRPGLTAMFAYLEAHPEVGFIIVNELERMTAGIGQRQAITSLCKRLRVTIITEDMGAIDPHDEDKMHEADQRAVAAKGEVLKVRRRTRRNLRAKVRSGTIVAMRPCFGVQMKPLVTPSGEVLPSGVRMLDSEGRKVTSGELELQPDEYPWLVKIFEWYANDDMSMGAIATKLNELGVPTKASKRKVKSMWRGNTVSGIIDNPFYKGELVWGRQQVLRDEDGRTYLETRDEDDPGRITKVSPLGAIIDTDLWERAFARRQEGIGKRRMTKRVYPDFPFDGRVYCGVCGTKMYGRPDNPERQYENIAWRYACRGKYRSGLPVPDGFQQCEKVNSILHHNLLKSLSRGKVVLPQGYRDRTKNRAVTIIGTPEVRSVADLSADVRRQKIEAEVEEARLELKNARRLVMKDLMEDDELAEVKVEVDERIAQLAIQLIELEKDGEQSPSLTGVPEVEFTKAYQELFFQLVELLADDALPNAQKVQALDRVGVVRVYVDRPGVRVQLRG